MPDVAIQAPAKKQKPLTPSFLYAGEGEALLKRLGEDVLKQLGEEKSYVDVFPAETVKKIRDYHNGSLKKEGYPGDFIGEVLRPVIEDFLNEACPSVKRKPQMAKWVLEQYLSHRQEDRPIKAEDLHKIGESIAYFDGLKKTEPFKKSIPKLSPELKDYSTYTAFEEMLAPYRQLKAKNEKLHDGTFKISTQEKAKVMAGTTMLYNGPEGQVVVVNTIEACNYWGRNTKWCINSERWRNYRINFPHYNKISPIIMFIPKGRHDDKVLLLDKTFYNSANEKIATLPQQHDDLLQKCLAKLSEGARKGFEPWIPEEAAALDGHPLKDAYAVRKLRNSFYFAASMKGNVRHPTKKKAPDNARPTARKVKALKRMAKEGDRKKLVQKTRRYPATWGNPDTLLAADPTATIRKIEAEMATSTTQKHSVRSRLHL